MSDTFCVLPWISLQLRPDGTVGACPLSQKQLQEPGGKDALYMYKHSVADALRSPTLAEIRGNLLAGVRDSNCALCWQDEACGRRSKRQIDNESYRDLKESILNGEVPEQPYFLDISPGNLCNLKCRICSGWNSSKWIEEIEEIYHDDGLPRNAELAGLSREDSRRLMMSWPSKATGFWDVLEGWAPRLRTLSFYGGEPFLNQRHFRFLEACVAAGHSKGISLHYNTNGTLFPEKAVREIFPHFQRVQLFFSVDGVGERFEYQRFGARWEEVKANIARARSCPGLQVAACLSVSSLNIFYIEETLDFFLAENLPVFFNLVHYPSYFSVRAIPRSVKNRILPALRNVDWGKYKGICLTDFAPILDLMDGGDDEAGAASFQDAIRRHDEYRGQSFAAAFPDYAGFFEARG